MPDKSINQIKDAQIRDAEFLNTAAHIGTRLCRDAAWSGNQCNWLGWSLDPVGTAWTLVYKAQSPYLYDGTAGIALFLARLASFTGGKIERSTAIGAMNRALAAIPSLPRETRHSVYSGAAGIAYVAIVLGELFQDERLMMRGISELRNACSGEPDERCIDLIAGSAGSIQVLLDVARKYGERDLANLAVPHAAVLLKTAVKSEEGLSWDTLPGQTERNLTGYGHGASGIGAALLEMWAETGDADCRDTALEAFRYERSFFSEEHHNWPDLRSMNMYGVPAGERVYAMAWCHGAPGIGLSRLRALELLGKNEPVMKDLTEALKVTASACEQVSFPASGSVCLCHGFGGNADLLINAADSPLDIQGRVDLRKAAEHIGRQAIEQIETSRLPWPCGVNGGGETPNLMLGLAGIGHFYLRLYDSANVPSVLLLAGAPQRQGAVREEAHPLAASA